MNNNDIPRKNTLFTRSKYLLQKSLTPISITVDTVKNHPGLGNLYLINNELEKSNEYLSEAIVRAKNEFKKNKENFDLNNKIYSYQISKMKNYQKLNQLDEAFVNYKNEIRFLQKIPSITSDTLKRLSYKNARFLLESYNGRGEVYLKNKKVDKALNDYINGLDVFSEFNSLDINNTTWQNEIFIQQIKIADIYKNQKDYNQSLVYYNDGLKVMKKLYDSNTSYQTWQLNLSLVYNRLGDVYKTENNLDKALKNYLKAFKIIEHGLMFKKEDKELKNRLSSSRQYINSIINLYIKRANSLQKESKFDNAIFLYQEAIKLLKTNKDIESFQNYIAFFNINIGNIYKYKREFDKALNFYVKSLIIREKLYKENPKNSYFSKKLHQNYEKIAGIYNFNLKKFDRAKEFYKKALEINNCTYSFTTLYELQIISNQDINVTLEEEYIKKFQNKKKFFIKYEILKNIKKISQKEKVNLEEWKTKYSGVSLYSNWEKLDKWVNNITNKDIKQKIKNAIAIFKKHQKDNQLKRKNEKQN